MDDTSSQFRFWSFGVAAENKALDADTLLVLPAEVVPFVDGELKGGTSPVEGTGTDARGQSYNVSVKQDSAVSATWLRMGQTNRRTSPDVRRGERVMLFRHSDSGDLWWQSMGMDDGLRRRETVIYSFANNPDEAVSTTDPANAYSIEFCTHTKQITLRTTKSDGEPFAYTMQFNTKDGAVILADDVGNFFQIDSAGTVITAQNKNGTYTNWDNDNIDMFAPQDITMRATNNVNIKAGNNAVVEGGTMAMLKGAGSVFTLTAGGTTLKTPKFDGGG